MARAKPSITVTKTVSMPAEILNAVADEAFAMGKSFSEAVVVLLRVGLAVRRQTRQDLDAETAEDLTKILGARQEGKT